MRAGEAAAAPPPALAVGVILSAQLGIDEVAAQVPPADKAATVERFQAGGHRVAINVIAIPVAAGLSYRGESTCR